MNARKLAWNVEPPGSDRATRRDWNRQARLLDSVRLAPVMARSRGNPDLAIGLIDGPVFTQHLDLAGASIRAVPSAFPPTCSRANAACAHGTFVAGILAARRGSIAPALCPDCTLLLRPIFDGLAAESSPTLTATAGSLAAAIADCVDSGARIINVSAALAYPSSTEKQELTAALVHAMQRNCIVVVAAGNDAAVGSSTIGHHPWTIPVIATDIRGSPIRSSLVGHALGCRGLGAPGDSISSLGVDGSAATRTGTSAAVAVVTGTLGLLWSMFPSAPAADVKYAALHTAGARGSAMPPRLDAWSSFRYLHAIYGRR